MNRLDKHFEIQKKNGKKSLIIYLTAGFPTPDYTYDLLCALVDNGADIIELGVPFSDPIADGPVIQKASEIALEAGTTVKKILPIVKKFRDKYSEVPLILFGAFNPFFKYGMKEIAADAKKAGADGFLAADLAVEEAEEFRNICKENEMCLVHLIAPTTPEKRRKMIAEMTTGFVYYISVKGVTGQRTDIGADIGKQVQSIKKITKKPVAVGFGVSKPEHVEMIAKNADGIIVGSALISEIMKHDKKDDAVKAAGKFVKALAKPLK